MKSLDIPVEVSSPATGMAQAVMHELRDRLLALAERAECHTVDLAGLPLTEADRDELQQLLGRGEVDISLSALGNSEIFETAFSGIWWIKHYTDNQVLISELIEVAPVPSIVRSQAEDIQASVSRLTQQIQTETSGAKYE